MKDSSYKPSGELQGDTRAMPDRGYGAGVTDSYGANLGSDATNSQGSLGNSAKSDPMDDCCAGEHKMRSGK